MNHDDTGHHLEQFAGEMLRSPVAARGIVDFARIGLGIGNELGDALGWKRWIDLHKVWNPDNSRNGRDVTEEIVVEPVVEGGINRMCRTYQEEGVAICSRTHDSLGSDVAARS